MMPSMTVANLPMEALVCVAQAERLQAAGAVCRNTFIEFPVSKRATQRRVRSSPPLSLCSRQVFSCDLASCEVDVPPSPTKTLPKRPRWSDEDEEFSASHGSSSASTVCSESEQHHRACEVYQSAETACVRAAEELAALVARDCGFLRIQSHSVQAQFKAGKRSAAQVTLRFFVQGLPFAKRAKWMQPLLWSIVAVLARSNVKATVKGGELMAVHASGLLIRIDFAAARM